MALWLYPPAYPVDSLADSIPLEAEIWRRMLWVLLDVVRGLEGGWIDDDILGRTGSIEIIWEGIYVA